MPDEDPPSADAGSAGSAPDPAPDERHEADGGTAVSDAAGADARESSEPPLVERVTDLTESFIRYVEVAAAAVFAVLFAIGVIDLTLQIVGAVRNGTITDPQVVVGFIDTGLLLLIIVEVYQTVVAYIEESDTRRIVRLVIYTGVIAMVRKVIIFRTGEYGTEGQALLAAVAYTLVILGLVGLLYAERQYTPQALVRGDDDADD